MKKTISVIMSIVVILSCFAVCCYAADKVDRIDLTVYSDIGNLNYNDPQYICTVDNAPDTLQSGVLLTYYNNQPYYANLKTGETYTLVLGFYFAGQLEISENFNIYVNNKALTPGDDYMMVYNPESNQTLLKVTYDVTVTAVAYKDVLNLTINLAGSTTIGWKNKAYISAPLSGFKDGTNPYNETLNMIKVGWYEGDELIAVTEPEMLYYYKSNSRTKCFCTERLTSAHTYTVKIVMLRKSENQYVAVSRPSQEKSITISVKTGFFDKITYFFQRLFGQDPAVDVMYNPA